MTDWMKRVVNPTYRDSSERNPSRVSSHLGALGPGEVGDVCVAGAVDDAVGEDGLPPRLALGDDALDHVALLDDLDGEAVQQGTHPGLS